MLQFVFRNLSLAFVLTAAVVFPAHLRGDDNASSASPGRVAILNNDSYVRVFNVFKTPVVVSKSGEITVAKTVTDKNPTELPEFLSPLPASDWYQPDFADTEWERQAAPVEMKLPWQSRNQAMYTAPANSMISLRWKFEAGANAGDLRLNFEYIGGAVVYVNGAEIARVNLPAGAITAETLAEKYQDDLTVMEDGGFLQAKHPSHKLKPEQEVLHELRYRRLADLAVPAKLLRKGENVLAIQLVRSPINEAAITAPRTAEGGMKTMPGLYPYVGLRSIELSAEPGSATVANVARPAGVQVWTALPFDTITLGDYDEMPASVPRKPLAFFGARNGVFSGRVVVSSGAAIENLSVQVSDLVREGGKELLSRNDVKLRYAEPSVPEKTERMARNRFDGLLDVVPSNIGLTKVRNVEAAMCPLWLTVRVPRDAAAGVYRGEVSVSATGLETTKVPVEFTVYDWVVPSPRNWHLNNFGYHAEESIARYYGVPRWSDEHFRLMASSFRHMAEVNSRQAIVNLAINFYGSNKTEFSTSNDQTMVRWIKQADGSFTYDFGPLDKFLEMVAQAIGKPTLLRFNCWSETNKKDGKLVGQGFKVSLLDSATGEVTPMDTPLPGTPEALAFWKPVLDEVRKRVEARGWWDVTAIGWNSYCYYPIPEVVDMAAAIWPDGVWSYTAHNGTRGRTMAGTNKETRMPILQCDTVWNLGALKPRGYTELLKPHYGYWCFTWRSNMRDWQDLSVFRIIAEDEILRGQDGVSDFGIDLFPLKNEKGRFYTMGNGRGTGGPKDSIYALLAPGAEGAIPTERFEALREGMQVAEAMLALQVALDSQTLPEELVGRVNKLLDARGEFYIRKWSSGRYEQDRKLFAMAAEVAQAIGKKN